MPPQSMCGQQHQPVTNKYVKKKKGKKKGKEERTGLHVWGLIFRNWTGGKLAGTTLPPYTSAVKSKLPDFLLSEGRKSGKCFLPPIEAAVKLYLPQLSPFHFHSHKRKE